ncbi:hypothetical protein KIH31_15025 [Paenarthrobacter sp. DKR-5]|uniref:hypothetical protein n=1 Tax=Paenarthrobacter sp. DKR-5 TaxID=2835535 RepID=UPI001BDCEAF6|nr:hypothetical protein [Paenarthrobacter sp. DKR-5]MBT1003907.1 hypothetical protein [Paenarthrobacter sp. DKR-5]
MNTRTSTDDSRPLRRKGRRWWLAGIVAVLVLAAGGIGYAMATGHQAANGAAQTMVAHAAQVMPFDLNATTHTFTKTTTGGIEQIVANSPGDQHNITLIQQHLNKEAGLFAQGNYSDPANIHGAAMPGLQELQAGASRVQSHYEQLPAGARITFSSGDAGLVAALHAWFDAQTMDHSMPGMGGGN